MKIRLDLQDPIQFGTVLNDLHLLKSLGFDDMARSLFENFSHWVHGQIKSGFIYSVTQLLKIRRSQKNGDFENEDFERLISKLLIQATHEGGSQIYYQIISLLSDSYLQEYLDKFLAALHAREIDMRMFTFEQFALISLKVAEKLPDWIESFFEFA